MARAGLAHLGRERVHHVAKIRHCDPLDDVRPRPLGSRPARCDHTPPYRPAMTPITASGWSCRRRAIKPYLIASGKPLTRGRIQSQTDRARASRTIPLRRCPNAGCRCWHTRRVPRVAREHNEYNDHSASQVPEHFSNEPFFDSRGAATAERLDILNNRSTARSPARGNPGHQGRPRVKRALILAR